LESLVATSFLFVQSFHVDTFYNSNGSSSLPSDPIVHFLTKKILTPHKPEKAALLFVVYLDDHCQAQDLSNHLPATILGGLRAH
jgi:hypothetical protein